MDATLRHVPQHLKSLPMKTSSVWHISLAIVLGLFVTLAYSVAASAQTPTPPNSPPSVTEPATSPLIIAGQLSNGTPGGSLPITTSVVLHAFDGDTMTSMTPGMADGSGRFRFEGVPNQQGRVFGVTATLGRTTYLSEPLNPKPGEAELPLTLKVFDTTTDAGQVRVEQLFVVGEFLNANELQLTNAYLLSNDGDHAVEGGEKGPDGQTATLRFDLPVGATGVQFQDEGANRFIRTSDGFLTTWGIPPGDQTGQVIVRYTLPYTGELHLETKVQYPVQALSLMQLDQGVALTSPQLKEKGTEQRQDGATVLEYAGESLSAGQSLVLDLKGAPVLSPVSGTNSKPSQYEVITEAQVSTPRAANRQPIVIGIGAFAVLLMVAGAIGLVWTRRSVEDDEYASAVDEQRVLILALADLDEAHEAGEIDDKAYAFQRQALKTTLVTALENRLVTDEVADSAVEVSSEDATPGLPAASQDGA